MHGQILDRIFGLLAGRMIGVDNMAGAEPIDDGASGVEVDLRFDKSMTMTMTDDANHHAFTIYYFEDSSVSASSTPRRCPIIGFP